MALKKEQKKQLIDKYVDALGKASTVVYVSFQGLNVNNTEKLRKELYQDGLNYKVVKKTLWNKALDTKNIEGVRPEIASELAVIYGENLEDILLPARLANDFARAHKKEMVIIGGIFDGVYRDQVSMLEISSIPSREVLLSKIAFLLQSPMQRLAIGISEVAKLKN